MHSISKLAVLLHASGLTELAGREEELGPSGWRIEVQHFPANARGHCRRVGCSRRRGCRSRSVGCSAFVGYFQIGYRTRHLAAIAEQDAELFKILIRQIGEDAEVDPVIGKALCVLPKSDLLKPVGDLLHRGSASNCRAFVRPRWQLYPRSSKCSRQHIPREWPHLDTARRRTAGQLSRVLPSRRPARAFHASEPVAGPREGPPLRTRQWRPQPQHRREGSAGRLKPLNASRARWSIRHGQTILGSLPLRLARNLQLEDRPELCQLRLDPFQ